MPHPQTQTKTRAARRHHAARTKRRVRREFLWLNDTSPTSVGMAARTPCACSCGMCTSHKKAPDRQRMRADARAESELAQLRLVQPRFEVYPRVDALMDSIHADFGSYIYASEVLDGSDPSDTAYRLHMQRMRTRYALAIAVITRPWYCDVARRIEIDKR